jgi:glycosyltransferase involved in cell wall biosynthesis
MRVCLIAVEIFAWGKYGGFGRATRLIGRELARRGVTVSAVVPRREGQGAVEDLDGIRVYGFSPKEPWKASKIYKMVDAEIYHSQEPSFGTYLAQRAMPDRKHIITFRDTRDAQDWFTEFRLPSVSPIQVISNWLYEDNWLVHWAVRHADGWYAAANLLVAKARAKYHLKVDPQFLPTPVVIADQIEKAPNPTVCFVSRWDRRKRPEIFFELAKVFPDVHFIAAGKSRDEAWDQSLRNQYGNLPNLELVGFLDQFRSNDLSQLLGRSWILVNTAAREGLPNAFIEAAAHGCAILSAVDPDGFASRFGYHAANDNFAQGLEFLLQNERWRPLAVQGLDYVRQVFSLEQSIDRHQRIYETMTLRERKF